MPKISVCIPTYNRAALLKGCLNSLVRQTYRDIEIIVSDNCSTDATAAVVADCPDPRLRYYRNDSNIGPYPNLNRLLELAQGEYVCILHDDDVYAQDFLEREAGMLDAHPRVVMVHCAVREVDEHGDRRQVVRAYPTTRTLDGRQEFVRYLQGHNVCCSSVMARRTAYQDAGPFDARYLTADFLMWMKLALRGDVAYIADPLLDMRVHAEAVTSWLAPSRWHEEFIAILEEGLALGATVDPSLMAERPALVRQAARAQGRRFLIAALAAIARGDFRLARGHIAVLEKLRDIGLSRSYAVSARWLVNRPGWTALSALARLRRARARRRAGSVGETMIATGDEVQG
jgi:glycosyltransferase involved in cell wall biosynthesis